MGCKVSDEFTVLLCRIHHRSLRLRGDEAAWWRQIKIHPLEAAQRLWHESRSNPQGPFTIHALITSEKPDEESAAVRHETGQRNMPDSVTLPVIRDWLRCSVGWGLLRKPDRCRRGLPAVSGGTEGAWGPPQQA
jgi:hypothetical protein